MTEHLIDRGCPAEKVWMDYLDPRGAGEFAADRAALEEHLDGCPSCCSRVEELRRFNTLFRHARIPGLGDEQWQVLDERMEMMGSEYLPPPRIATRIYFGMAMAAALGLFAVGLWHLLYGGTSLDRSASPRGVASAPAIASALEVGAVEGRLEVADARGAWRVLTGGTMLRASTRLRNAGSAGPARLVVPGHFELRVTAGSELEFEAADTRRTWLRLRDGEVACMVAKRGPNQQFRVLAGRFRASVVGTEFVVSLGRDKADVQVRVSEGAVRVDEADGPDAATSESLIVVRAGNRWRSVGGRIEYGPMADRPAPAGTVDPRPGPPGTGREETVVAPNTSVARRVRATANKHVGRRHTRRAVARKAGDAAAAQPVGHPAPKVVEIELPAQWHPLAEAAEVERLRKLGAHSRRARADKEAATSGWHLAPGADKVRAGP